MSAISTATGYVLDGRESEIESRQDQDFSPLHVVQTGSGALPASYPMGTKGSTSGGKAAWEWNRFLPSNWLRGQEYVDLYIHTPSYVFMT
jgi:hypothetical protein